MNKHLYTIDLRATLFYRPVCGRVPPSQLYKKQHQLFVTSTKKFSSSWHFFQGVLAGMLYLPRLIRKYSNINNQANKTKQANTNNNRMNFLFPRSYNYALDRYMFTTQFMFRMLFYKNTIKIIADFGITDKKSISLMF